MFKNYLKLSIRNLLKNKVSSFINIIGLSVGLATGIIIMLVIADEFSYDKYNKNLGDMYLLMKNQNMSGDINTGKATPGPLAASVRDEIPGIKYVTRVSEGSQELIKTGNKMMYQEVVYSDPDFFNMMTLPAIEGNPVEALHEPSSVVITKSTAKKLFGNEEAIGKVIVHNNLHTLKVAAVIRDVPENSTTRFDMVLPFSILEKDNSWLSKWDDNRIGTWIQVAPHTNMIAMNSHLKNLFLAKQDEKNIDLFAYPFSALRLHGKFKNGVPNGGTIDIIILLGIIALFVLLIACINFMNLATARSQQRAREVGVRKVMGASRKVIIFQFLSEALVMSLLALGLSTLLANIVLPGFMQVTGKHFTPAFFNWRIWMLMLSLAVFTGLIAGSYPAFYLSSFKPVEVLKKVMIKGKTGGLLRKSLVSFQFIISIFLIIGSIVIFKQLHYLQNRPIGYETNNLIDITARGDMANKFDLIKNELTQIPGVKSVSAGSDNLVNFGGAFNGLEWPGKTADQDFYIHATYVRYNWIATAGLQLKEGRDFSDDYGGDSANCIINEAAAKKMNLKEPVIGTRLGSNMVIGIIKDFVYNNPSGASAPLIVYLSRGPMDHFLIRIANNDQWHACIEQITKGFKKVNPNFPFEFNFTKEEYQKSFDAIRSVGEMANIFGGMAIFICCLGLFGLSAFLAEKRGKEISIRKVLGASVSSVWLLLSTDFMKPVVIAFIIAAPIAGIVMQKALQQMDYHIQLSWWMFGLAGVLAVIIALLTVSYNGIKAALANPVKNLGAE